MHSLSHTAAAGASSSSTPSAVLSQLGHLSAPVAAGGVGGTPGAAGSSVGLGIMVGGLGGAAGGGQLDLEVLRKMMQVREGGCAGLRLGLGRQPSKPCDAGFELGQRQQRLPVLICQG